MVGATPTQRYNIIENIWITSDWFVIPGGTPKPLHIAYNVERFGSDMRIRICEKKESILLHFVQTHCLHIFHEL